MVSPSSTAVPWGTRPHTGGRRIDPDCGHLLLGGWTAAGVAGSLWPPLELDA